MYAKVLRIPFVCTYTVMSWLYKELAVYFLSLQTLPLQVLKCQDGCKPTLSGNLLKLGLHMLDYVFMWL